MTISVVAILHFSHPQWSLSNFSYTHYSSPSYQTSPALYPTVAIGWLALMLRNLEV